MARQQSAVIGIGQTDYKKKLDVSLDGLTQWAAEAALDDAGIDWKDVDAIVVGKAPDAHQAFVFKEMEPGPKAAASSAGQVKVSALPRRGQPGSRRTCRRPTTAEAPPGLLE